MLFLAQLLVVTATLLLTLALPPEPTELRVLLVELFLAVVAVEASLRSLEPVRLVVMAATMEVAEAEAVLLSTVSSAVKAAMEPMASASCLLTLDERGGQNGRR